MRVYEIAVMEGDGIGPEVIAPAVAVLKAISLRAKSYELQFNTVPAGAGHYARTGEALPRSSLDAARAADAILLSAMGLPDVRYPDGTEISPQIELRKELDLYAGVRPVKLVPNQPSPLSQALGEPIDFVLVRESTEGLFYSQGRGEVTEDDARETLRITRQTSQRVFDFSFRLAAQRKKSGRGKGRVTCVDKANVFRAFAFFREIFDGEALRYPDIEADHAYVDATALRMVQQPWSFDVLVTENMFGDILSDLGAGIMGGLGLAPSADIGCRHAVFQPCHGSAPDIAGQDRANPLAMIMSAAMMLDWLAQQSGEAEPAADAARLDRAVADVISSGDGLTRDLGGRASTGEAGARVLDRLLAA